tara:strand:+ start:1843 stop:2337 length:495 start_codon:yes stop_codon:yes gene_type:complete
MVLIGLGSNQGDSVQILRETMDDLSVFADGEFRKSSLWLTSPVDCPPGSPDFINAAVAFFPEKELTPEKLLLSLKAIEKDFHRDRDAPRNSPRLLDLDLLLFGNEIRQQEYFILPHPRAVKRKFVLAPASEVLPEAVWPGEKQTILDLFEGLSSSELIRRLDDA